MIMGSTPSHLSLGQNLFDNCDSLQFFGGLAGHIRRSTEHQGVPLLAEVGVLWLTL